MFVVYYFANLLLIKNLPIFGIFLFEAYDANASVKNSCVH